MTKVQQRRANEFIREGTGLTVKEARDSANRIWVRRPLPTAPDAERRAWRARLEKARAVIRETHAAAKLDRKRDKWRKADARARTRRKRAAVLAGLGVGEVTRAARSRNERCATIVRHVAEFIGGIDVGLWCCALCDARAVPGAAEGTRECTSCHAVGKSSGVWE